MNHTSNDYIPKKGDIIYIELDPVVGHEQKGRRPVVVLSPSVYNKHSELCVAIPITSVKKNYPFETVINSKKVKGVALVDQVRSLSWKTRNISYVETIEGKKLDEISKLLHMLIIDSNT